MYGSYDGLRLCQNCHDAYTLGSLCSSCSHQEMIDKSDYEPTLCRECRSWWVLCEGDNPVKWECQECGHRWVNG